VGLHSLVDVALGYITAVEHLVVLQIRTVRFQLGGSCLIRVVFGTHLPELNKLITVGFSPANPPSLYGLSEIHKTIRRPTVFTKPLLHILVDLKVTAVESPAMLIDFERVPRSIVLVHDELLEQVGGAVLAVEQNFTVGNVGRFAHSSVLFEVKNLSLDAQ